MEAPLLSSSSFVTKMHLYEKLWKGGVVLAVESEIREYGAVSGVCSELEIESKFLVCSFIVQT